MRYICVVSLITNSPVGNGMELGDPPVQNHPAEQFPVGIASPSPWQNIPGGQRSHDPTVCCVVSSLYVPSGQGNSVA